MVAQPITCFLCSSRIVWLVILGISSGWTSSHTLLWWCLFLGLCFTTDSRRGVGIVTHILKNTIIICEVPLREEAFSFAAPPTPQISFQAHGIYTGQVRSGLIWAAWICTRKRRIRSTREPSRGPPNSRVSSTSATAVALWWATVVPMSGDGNHPPGSQVLTNGLDAHRDARAIVRLLQCSQCSYPLREPMTLPCGNSLCRPCLPPLYKRENITYPMNAGRSEGFICPFKDCGLEHSLGDCSIDVTLNKLVDLVRDQVARYRVETSETPLLLDERLHWKNVIDSSMDVMPRSRVLHGGRLVATYTFADMGELNHDSEVAYTPVAPSHEDALEALDVAVLEHLKEATRTELECHVCYALMLGPSYNNMWPYVLPEMCCANSGSPKSLPNLQEKVTHATWSSGRTQ